MTHVAHDREDRSPAASMRVGVVPVSLWHAAEPVQGVSLLSDPAGCMGEIEPVPQAVSPDAWLTREMARREEERRLRKQASLQRKLGAAEGYEKVGRWACFATGNLWLVAIGASIVHSIRDSTPDGPIPILFIAWLLLPVWALVYLVGWVRRRWVMNRARRHGVELQVRRPIVRRWIVVEASAAPEEAREASRPVPPGVEGTAGARLDASLAQDREGRRQRERTMQRGLDAACRFEEWGRRDCLWSAFLALAFWASLVTSPGTELPKGIPLAVMFVSGIGGTVGLALGTLAVLGAKLRQRWLLKQAREQALEVTRVNDSPFSTS